jgi:hypothetical protein
MVRLLRPYVAVLLVALLGSGCSTAWPRVTAVSDARFGAWSPPATIDVLPIDLEVWTEPGVGADADQVRQQAESRIIGATTELMYRRGYAVAAVLDWQGTYVDRNGVQSVVIEPPALLQTVDSLASYGSALAVTPKEMPAPYLPVRLGEKTGSDATLYIGGWGFVGHSSSVGDSIAKGILIGVLVVGVVVVAAAISKSDTVDKVLGGAARGAGHAAKALSSAGRLVLRAAAKAGSAVVDLARVGVDVTVDVVNAVPADAFGREETHLNLVSGRPEWSQAADAKRQGSSALYLEMTLVDNHTGLVRWHAHQQFPANPKNNRDVIHAVASMLASLPAR